MSINNINSNLFSNLILKEEQEYISKTSEGNKNLSFTPTMQRNYSFHSSNSKKNSNTNFTTNFSESNNNLKTVYSPFVIKKTSENPVNINSNVAQKLNFNNFANKTDNSGLNILNCNSSSKTNYDHDFSNNIFNKNHFSPESQNTVPNHKIYSPSPINVKNERLSDRFIPMNKGTNLLEKFELTNTWETKIQGDIFSLNSDNNSNLNEKDEEKKDQMNSTYHNLLQNNFFGFDQNFEDPILKSLGKTALEMEGYNKANSNNKGNIKSKIFKFKTETKKNSGININLGNIFDTMQSVNTNFNNQINNINSIRKIANRPYKILEAPGLLDDFYLNLLDWSSRNDIAVGLDNSVYLWCANKTQMVNLFSYGEEKYVSSIIWNQSGTELAVGNSEGVVEIWDVEAKKIKRTLTGHTARVGVVAWHSNNISSGSKDYSIINHDLRGEEKISKLLGHKQEVCGLKWSFDGINLASGGNDNKLMIWNVHNPNPVMKSSSHQAAVKALAWSPHQHNLLTSGGGTADKCIRFWNTNNYQQINCVDTGSQVCNLVFSKTVNELVSTHGYSLNQINVWKLPNMTKLATLTGHTYRVLYLSLSPDGQNVVTGAGDETLRFWNVFPNLKQNNQGSALSLSNADLR